MADFLLSVGVDTKLSYTQMQNDITNLVNDLNKNPPRIKVAFDIDKSTTDAIRAQISEIRKSTSAVGAVNIHTNMLDTNSVRAVVTGMSDIVSSSNKAAVAVGNMSASLSSINAQKIQDVLNGISGISSDNASRLTRSISEAEVKISEISAKWEDVKGKEQQVLNLTVKGNNSLGQTVSYLVSYDKKTGDIKRTLGGITAKFKEAKDAASSVSQKIDSTTNSTEKTSSALSEAKRIINEYYSTLRKVTNEPDVIKSSKGFVSISGNYKELATAMNEVHIAYTAVRAAMISMPEEERISLLERVESAERSLRVAVEERKNAESRRDSSHPSTSEQSLLKETTVLGNYQTTLTRLQKAEENWTAAKNHSSEAVRNAYSAIQKQADKLRALDGATKNLSNNENIRRQQLNDIKIATEAANNTIKTSETVIKGAGAATKTWGERVGSLAEKFGTWFSITRVMMAAYRAVRQMVTSVIELDTAMTELKKVTDETDATYEKFLTNATVRARNLGASLSDTVTATADFARLGYNLEQAEKLADAAIVYKNVGDGISDITTASESIIATMQAFGISAEEAMLIVDKFNEVGNNYAISSKGVGDALLRSAAAMHAANNSLDETIALATAANTVVQDPEKVGTTLKTVSMFLRAAKTEAEEAGEATEGMANSVSELRDEILSLTGGKVDIQIDEDTFKSTYQILKELSTVWGELTDISQANILEMIGGKRNSNVVSALLENFSVAENALETSANSAGSALAENEKVLESIQGKINILKASFETFSQNLIGSDTVKLFVDAGTAIINFLNGTVRVIEALGGLKTVLLATASILAIAKAAWTAHMIAMIKNAVVSGVVGGFKKVVSAIKLIINIIPFAITQWKGLAAGTVSASAAMQASIPVIGLVLAALTALVGGLSLYSKKADEAKQAAIDVAEAYREQQSEMASTKETINGITDKYAELSNGVDAFGNNISLTTAQYEEYKDIVSQIANMFPTMIQGYNDEGLAILSCKGNVEKLIEAYNNLAKAQNNKVLNEASTLFDDFKDKRKDFDESNFKGNEYTTSSNEALRKILGSTNIEAAIDSYASTGTTNMVQIVQALKDAGLKQKTGGFLGLGGESGRDFIARAVRENKEVVASIVGNFDEEMSVAAQNMQSIVDAYIGNAFMGSYSDISPDVQNLVSSIVSGFNADFYSQFDTLNDLYDYLNQLLGSFKNLSKDDANTLTATFNLKASYDNGECTIEEYVNGVKKAKGVIDQFDDDTQKRLNLALGFNDNDIEKQYDDVLNKLGDKNKDWLNSLNQDDFALIYKISLENDTASWELDDWIEKLKQSREESAKSNLALSDLSKSLTGLKNAYSLLETAQKDMLSGGLSESTIKSLADITDDYIDYLYEENGVIKLNTDAWKEYANREMKSSIQAIESEISALEKEREEIETNIDVLNNATVVADGFMGPLEQGTMYESEFNAALAEQNERLSENTSKLEENQSKLGIYSTLYNNIAGSLDAYSAALANFTNISNAITSVSDSLTTVADLQETVANGFTISLEKALEFAKVYPEILNGATVAANGQIALNKDIVNAFIEGKEAELKAQIDAEIAKLESDKSVLTAKMNFAKAELDLAKNVGEGEGQISQELAEYRVNAGNAVAQALIDSGIDEATAYQLAMAAMAQNSEEFNRIAAQVCTDVDGNFNQAAYSAAQGIYNNMKNASSSLDGIIKAAHNAADAIAGIANGKRAGTTGSFSGSGGSSGSTAKITLSNGTFNGVDYSYSPNTVSLDKFISDLELDISSYQNAISQIDGQIATLKALRNTSLNKFSTSSKKASSGSGSGKGSGSKSKSDEESWFEKQYKLHNHLMDMDAENVADYLEWLNSAYQQAYKEGIIDIDEFYKYQEEVYKGLQDLFKDYLNDVEHEISMRENFDGESKKIVSLYKELIAAVEKEIKAARAQGLDDTDDYIQSLQSKWAGYKDSIKEIEEDAKDNAKDAVDELIDIRIDMLKQDIKNEKDAIDKKLDYLKEFYDKQKEMLQDAYDEEKYLDEQSEKRKTISDISAEMAQLEYDNSAWAQKRKLELAKELADSQKDLDDFEKDHALQAAQDQLDALYEAQEKELEAQNELLESKENDAKALYDQALADIKNGSIALYEEMVEWNNLYGDGIEATIKTAWEDAYVALQNYYDLYGKLYEDIKLANATGYEKPKESWDNSPVSGTNPNNKPNPPASSGNSGTSKPQNNAPSLSKGSSVTVKKSATHFSAKSNNVRMASFVPGGKYTVYQTSGNEVLIGRNGVYTGWIKKTDIVGYATGTRSATAGLHSIDEKGAETIFESKDGSRYKMFSGGEKVLNARASDFLYEFANGGGEILGKIFKSALGGGLFDKLSPVVNHNEVRMGDIIVRGNADKQTVSEIRRAQREGLSDMLKSLNKLNK